MSTSLAAVFVGSDTLLLQCVDAWLERGHRVVAVVTDADKVRRFCGERSLRHVDAAADIVGALAGETADVLFTITWLQLVPADALKVARRCAINFHDGPLPRYAGLNATCWSILRGEHEHAVTWHVIEEKADTGDILLQRTFPIQPDDTAFTLNARCFQVGQETFAELTDQLAAGTEQRRPQDLSLRTYFGKNARPDALALVDFAQPAADVARLVRAFDHGGYRNPIAIAKVRCPHGVFVPGGVEVVADGGSVAGSVVGSIAGSAGAPGTVVAVTGDAVHVACGDGAVRLLRPRCQRGSPLSAEALAQLGVTAGQRLPLLAADERDALTAIGRAAARSEEAWLRVLRDSEPLPVPDGGPGAGAADVAELAVPLPAADALECAAWCVAFFARQSARTDFAVGVSPQAPAGGIGVAMHLVVGAPPVPFHVDPSRPVGDVIAGARAALKGASANGPLQCDVVVRRHDVLSPAVVLSPPVRIALGAPSPDLAAGSLELVPASDGALRVRFDRRALPEAAASALVARLQVFVRGALAAPSSPLAMVPLLDERELDTLLHRWNATAGPAPAEPCVHRQFAAMAARTPAHVALRAGDDAKTYADLLADSGRLAAYLRSRGVKKGGRVGVCTQRGFGMVTAVLATLRCGAAYVPLDPSYPRERLQFMAGDAELSALIVDRASQPAAPTVACPTVDLDADTAAVWLAGDAVDENTTGDDLAYVIYTSGSTGQPKGVMVRHRNVTNFFAGMDEVLGTDPGTWLAVTSLSFDISVLELLWTTCRGFTVVIHHGEGAASQHAAAAAAVVQARPVTFSLFYFASDEGERAEDKYRLLIEGARFADQNGFEAVWTPERHFHAFGGLYPNPAVASAAIASITQNIAIRAGSCVVTLHHPIRVAEDWALVDNLSKGRVGIAFAAGWHARDFVLRPENFADKKQALVASMRQVQALWRGETVEFPGHDGKPVPIRTLPRPVQKTLPSWVTIAGNPDTYRLAGESGSYVLTHLLGQSAEELAQKLDVYRRAWRAAGHPGDGKVTLMLHTFVGDDDEQVRETVRAPMKAYLRSSLDLVKQAAWSFPAFKQRVDKPGEMDALLNGGLTPADFEALLDFSFERYYRTSGLFGTPATCEQIVDRLRAMQVDEIACLIDFGVPTDAVVAMLPKLVDVKRRCDAASAAASRAAAPATGALPATIPELLQRHRVTHFQCTPSMAGMVLVDPQAPAAFRGLSHLLVGGEALPTTLARELKALVPAVHDVYGPTETTVWSTTMRVGDDEPVPIGRPLRNQRVYVLDPNLQPVPPGSPGELWIGGAGVTAGYHRRAELTADRFRPDPFTGGAANGASMYGSVMYGTGDLARWRSDGVLEYLGRKDHQVKVRGYRIELGEIETVLCQHKGVREGVVVARNDGGETRLVAYFVAKETAPKADELRAHVRAALPEFMVPSHFVVLADLPRTPNLKVDRKALPAPEAAVGKRTVASAQDATEDAILAIWKQALGTEDVGVEDNFFDSGGHSILAVRVHREIVQRLGVELQITDLFRFTTVRSLARHLQAGKSAPTAAQQAMERAKQRRNLLRRS